MTGLDKQEKQDLSESDICDIYITLALCDNLKSKINNVRSSQIHLTDTVVEQAVA